MVLTQCRALFIADSKMAKPTVTEVKTQIDTHEAICAERWQETINRIKRLEMIIIGSGGAIILLLINIIVFGD